MPLFCGVCEPWYSGLGTRSISWLTVYLEILYGPLPIGSFAQAAGSLKKAAGSGSKPRKPRDCGQVEFLAVSATVKVVSLTTFSPDMVFAVGLPVLGATAG